MEACHLFGGATHFYLVEEEMSMQLIIQIKKENISSKWPLYSAAMMPHFFF
ncbi:hypothetical protein C1H46_024544 [Malus baccata]|uniref:Uncharacterized protein n=1 Tax=Malus baccata TaxID=106549 RepID=A0A540LTS2_MALBA|nr:hypothetical protein C1H46_024544 [Malus baccata]